RSLPRQRRRARLTVAGVVFCLEAGDGPSLDQPLAQWPPPAATSRQPRGLAPAAGTANFLGPGKDHALIGSQLENAGQVGLAVGLAAELAVDRCAVQMQRPILGTGGNQAVEIPQCRSPALGLGAIEHTVRLEVEDLLARAESLGILEIVGHLIKLVGQGP